ncbi:cytidylyltransferase domain-containing protein [Leptospira meyeri]|uniref:cytidylyltransferase domain-containing protein n=1 Tax=Leptospira meyeri TaxID=29508 RepID=UPI0010827AA5|nr:hypothetical protein [Leptospira meyeri]MCW7490404.1 hypothetical protein [Leptospira meyeri]TGM62098.1 hypothetical protein EHQ93_12300 [Leptospira meyeri]
MKQKVLLLLQSRLSSSRLPAKALLSIGGFPMVVLAAKRSMNTGYDLSVVTSDHSDDDLLVDVLGKYGLKYFRGSLTNVLERFQIVINRDEYKSKEIFVRLTADNVIPDGALIGEAVECFVNSDCDYLTTIGQNSNLPYGVTLEIFSRGAIEKAYKYAKTDEEREHVTVWISRNLSKKVFLSRFLVQNKSNESYTIDNYCDYVFVSKKFLKLSDTILAPWNELIE